MNKKIIVLIILLVITAIIAIVAIFAGNKSFNESSNYSEKDYKYFVLYAANGKVGVIDDKGEVLINPFYTDIYIPNQTRDVFVCFSDKNSKIVNKNEDALFIEYGDVSALVTSEGNSLDFEKDVLKFRKDDLYGLIDFDGKIILNAKYDDITSVEHRPGRILVKKDGLYGIVDSKGNTLIPVGYYSIKGDEYNTESEGYAKTGYVTVKKTSSGMMSGYVDYNGKKILDNKFDSIDRVFKPDSDIYLIVMQNGRKGVYKNGSKIVDTVYQDISYSKSANIFIVNKNGKYGFYNLEGRQILQNMYNSYAIAGKYIAVEENGQKSLFDTNGNFIEQKNYSRIIDVENSNYIIAVDSQDGTYSIISKEVNIKNNYRNISYLFDDYFCFENSQGKCGVLSAKQGEIIDATYDVIITVSGINAIEAKTNDGESTFYNKKMEKISTFSYPIVEELDNNFALIYNSTDRIYLDKSGNIVSIDVVNPSKKLYAFKDENDLWGYKDNHGNVVLDAEYSIATELDSYGFGAIMKNDLWGVVDSEGKVLIEPSYTLQTYYYPKFIGKYLVEQVETMHVVEVD